MSQMGHLSPCRVPRSYGRSTPSNGNSLRDQSLTVECQLRTHQRSKRRARGALLSVITLSYGWHPHSRNAIYVIVASGGELFGTPPALYSKPFAFRTVWAAGEERNVTNALAASA
jgi:hypothetical protein